METQVTGALEKSLFLGAKFEWKELNKRYKNALLRVLVFIGELKEAGWQWVPQHEEVRGRGDFAKPCLPRRPTILWMH